MTSGTKSSKMLWAQRFGPLTLDECAGNDEARGALKTWALDWERGKAQKPLLISGPTGCGKTSAVRGLAEQMQWPLVTVDVSGARDPKKIKQMLEESATVGGLFSNHRLFFIDELDGAVARGQMPVVAEFARQDLQPTIFAVNDAWETKLSPIRALCKQVEFKGVNPSTVARVLSTVSGKVHAADPSYPLPEVAAISAISKSCGGDLRAAINDLQSGGEPGLRDTEVDVFKTVAKILKAQTAQDALLAAESSEVDLPMLIKWVEENVPEEFESIDEVANAFNWLSRADVFQGRISRRQQWGLLAYVRFLSIAGASSSKAQPYAKFTRYRFPSYIRSLSSSRARRAVLESSVEKLGLALHCSKGEARESLLYLSSSPKVLELAGLSEEEIEEAAEFAGSAPAKGKK